jgi:hypothetical protein
VRMVLDSFFICHSISCSNHYCTLLRCRVADDGLAIANIPRAFTSQWGGGMKVWCTKAHLTP